MENKTAEEILEKYCPSMSNIYLDDNGIKFRARVVKSMEEYASQQLAEKDKEIERYAIEFAEWFTKSTGKYTDDILALRQGKYISLYKQSLNK